ncbi:hypothetical protein ATM17_16060 [Sphingopyxis macrogoltabida]|uniref:Uncharacterized protein n=2 Tax=Sphingopyxis macrogoltabida TaxID=33050 RepID=A0AAC8Z239_SPHMC|nr:hypothetical protein ATM17_16060 [Sphingopyxis macrogoltabida]
MALGGGKVECAELVHFDFTTQPMGLWNGGGILRTNDARLWSGLGTLGSMSGIEQAVNGEAPESAFTLSGIDADVLRLSRQEFEPECKGRIVRVLIQFFGIDDPADPGNQRPLDNPFPIHASRILGATFTVDQENGERAVTLSGESLFSLRSRPKYAMYTDRDQQRRFPGDKGFEFVQAIVNKVLTWPDY